MKLRRMITVAATAGIISLAGCVDKPQTLYYWGDYQGQVYDYLLRPDAGEVTRQVQVLEKGYQKALAGNQPLPPGYHAHLGMLYFARGQVDKAVEQFQLEKTEFPESTVLMDRMLAKFK